MSRSPGAVEATVRECLPMLARIAASYAADPARRDDLLQEMSIAAWQALPRWRGEGSVRAFVARVAHNRAMTVLVRERRAAAAELDDAVPDPGPGPQHSAEAGQCRDALLRAVRRLPLGYRQPVVLALEGFSQREIAEALGLEENTVAQRLSRARRRLREAMEVGA